MNYYQLVEFAGDIVFWILDPESLCIWHIIRFSFSSHSIMT